MKIKDYSLIFIQQVCCFLFWAAMFYLFKMHIDYFWVHLLHIRAKYGVVVLQTGFG